MKSVEGIFLTLMVGVLLSAATVAGEIWTARTFPETVAGDENDEDEDKAGAMPHSVPHSPLRFGGHTQLAIKDINITESPSVGAHTIAARLRADPGRFSQTCTDLVPMGMSQPPSLYSAPLSEFKPGLSTVSYDSQATAMSSLRALAPYLPRGVQVLSHRSHTRPGVLWQPQPLRPQPVSPAMARVPPHVNSLHNGLSSSSVNYQPDVTDSPKQLFFYDR